jgi:hypothetical protein
MIINYLRFLEMPHCVRHDPMPVKVGGVILSEAKNLFAFSILNSQFSIKKSV